MTSNKTRYSKEELAEIREARRNYCLTEHPLYKERIKNQDFLEVRIAYKVCDQMTIHDAWEIFQRGLNVSSWLMIRPAELVMIQESQQMLSEFFSDYQMEDR